MQIDKHLFSLFHHDLDCQDETFSFNSIHLFSLSQEKASLGLNALAQILQSIVSENIKGFSSDEISLTLTGGMDSRLILACLLKAGIKPNCLTFGNPNTRDVVFAKKIAGKFSLPFHNTCQKLPEKDWYYKWVIETLNRDNGNAHLHRAHRTAAIAEHAEKFNPKVLFTGHMGGEGLRGLTYNNYFSSSFFETVNEGKKTALEAAKQLLRENFLNDEYIDYESLIQKIQKLSWMKHDRKTNKFFFLYDLVAKIHHAQDIRLYRTFIPSVIPIYLEKNYLELLFKSEFNFLVKKNRLISRLKNPLFYCEFIKEIYPPLLDLPFANGFTPNDYLKGLWYYVPKKIVYDQLERKKYQAAFSYGPWFVDFVREHSYNIDPEIWEVYDKNRYMNGLNKNIHQTNEGYWHKFSNPIFFDLVNKFNRDKL